jgi:hypothetical protein
MTPSSMATYFFTAIWIRVNIVPIFSELANLGDLAVKYVKETRTVINITTDSTTSNVSMLNLLGMLLYNIANLKATLDVKNSLAEDTTLMEKKSARDI